MHTTSHMLFMHITHFVFHSHYTPNRKEVIVTQHKRGILAQRHKEKEVIITHSIDRRLSPDHIVIIKYQKRNITTC